MLFNILLAMHVAGGSISLVSGPVALAARKGGILHRRGGLVFACAMALTAAAAVPLSLMTSDVLLLVIAVLTGFLVNRGVMGIRRRRRPRASTWQDAIVPALCLVFCAGLLAYSLPLAGRPSFITGQFFGAGGMVLAVRELRALRDPATNWLQSHIAGMMGAYIATVTAFLVVNLTFLPHAIVFIVPTLIGSPMIFWMMIKHTGKAQRRGDATA
jgi:uncharacterized membrane protein